MSAPESIPESVVAMLVVSATDLGPDTTAVAVELIRNPGARSVPRCEQLAEVLADAAAEFRSCECC